MMELVVLGSGTLIPNKDRSCSAYILRHTRGYSLLDCGPGCLLRLNQAGVSVMDLSLVLISHFHWDHISELPAILNSRWLQRADGEGCLTVAGPPGLCGWIDRIMAEDRDWLAELNLRLEELNEGETELGDFSIRSGRSFHTDNSLSFRLEEGRNSSLFYSGDMDYQESVVPLATEVDLAVVECSWLGQNRGGKHMDPQLAARFAAEARVQKLLLTHFYQEVVPEQVISQVKHIFPGSIMLAEDLGVYSIP